MKKVKQLFALFLAMAMVLGMSMTTFAAGETQGTGQITVTNIALPNSKDGIGNAKVEYAKVITPDPAEDTGWKFVNAEYATAYKTAYGVTDDQAAIKALIAAKGTGAQADGEQTRTAIGNASAKVTDWKTGAEAVSNGTATWNVADQGPGIYVIKITQTNHNYLSMAAYVGFGQISRNEAGDGYKYPVMYDAALVAKGSSIELTKSVTDTDGVVAVGDPLTYTIETTVPYIESANLTSASYWVHDEITGASYGDLTAATIKYKDTDEAVPGVAITHAEGAKTFTLDLTSVLAKNANANRIIVITYTATVEEVNNITNTASAGQKSGDNITTEYGTDDDEVFTGEITVTKRGELPEGSTDDEQRPLLPGAEFEVRKMVVKDGQLVADENPLTFTAVMSTSDPKVVDYYKYDSKGTLTKVVTKAGTGAATIKGLDIGQYSFKEVVAPEGYTINLDDESGEIKLNTGVTKAEKQDDIVSVGAFMNDTTISALPSTGGIGITIFTVGGCAIMILAAGMFFVSRRRASR